MNVLQIVPELRSGGVERGTVDFAKYLADHGHRSIVVSNGGSLVSSMVGNGVIHYKFPVHKKSLFSVLAEAKNLEKILRSESIDIVHARSRVPAWIAFIACRKVGVPMITTCHGIYGTHALSRVMGWGRTVISISTAVTRHMTQRFQVPYKRIELIHRGVNLKEFSEKALTHQISSENSHRDRNKGEFVIGIVGRITPIKGHPILIRAMARIARVYPQAKLWIIGDSPKHRYGEELRHLVTKLNLTQNVEFLGTQKDIPALLSKMDLLVAPAVGEEAFGRVMIEAGALGIPVIASRIGGIVDVIRHGKDGILTTAGDVTMLAEAILGVLREPQLAQTFIESLKARVKEKFDDQLMFKKTVDVYHSALIGKRILIIKFGAVGDAVLISPSIREIRKAYPKAHIAILCDRSCREIFSKNKHVDDVVAFDRSEIYSPMRLWRLINILSREAFDVAIDFQNNKLSHLLAYFSGAYVRIGYETRKFDHFLNFREVLSNETEDPVQQQFRLLNRLGIQAENSTPEWELSTEDVKQAEQILMDGWLSSSQLIVGINPGSSPAWKTKRWIPAKYAEFCDRLSESNIRVVITGSDHDSEVVSEIVKLAKSKPFVAVGKTNIASLAALIDRFAAFVTSDSAPLHLANAVGTPYVAIFGPTDPARHIPPGTVAKEVIWKHPKCSPCYSKKCPIGLICMTGISVNEVYSATMSLVRAQTPSVTTV